MCEQFTTRIVFETSHELKIGINEVLKMRNLLNRLLLIHIRESHFVIKYDGIEMFIFS